MRILTQAKLLLIDEVGYLSLDPQSSRHALRGHLQPLPETRFDRGDLQQIQKFTYG
jgi:hypothetical protein